MYQNGKLKSIFKEFKGLILSNKTYILLDKVKELSHNDLVKVINYSPLFERKLLDIALDKYVNKKFEFDENIDRDNKELHLALKESILEFVKVSKVENIKIDVNFLLKKSINSLTLIDLYDSFDIFFEVNKKFKDNINLKNNIYYKIQNYINILQEDSYNSNQSNHFYQTHLNSINKLHLSLKTLSEDNTIIPGLFSDIVKESILSNLSNRNVQNSIDTFDYTSDISTLSYEEEILDARDSSINFSWNNPNSDATKSNMTQKRSLSDLNKLNKTKKNHSSDLICASNKEEATSSHETKPQLKRLWRSMPSFGYSKDN